MRILFCGDSFPGHFSALASALASQGHEVLFASHYGRRDFALPGVHRVLLKPVRERSPLKRTLTSARQAHAAFLSLRDAGLAPDAVLFSASSAIPLWAHKAFPEAMLFGYADSAVLLADPSPSEQAVPGEEEQAAMLRSSALAHCHAIFAFSEQCLAGLPPLMARNARVLPAFIDTDFFSPDSAKPFACAGRVFPQDGELVAMDIRPHRGEDSLAPRALWELALGILAHRPHCTVLLNCANAELKEASQDLAKRLPESWQARLAVQGYSSLESWRDMLAASSLFVLPDPCITAGGVVLPEALEAMACGSSVASPCLPGQGRGAFAPAMPELAQDSAEKRFLRVCEHLDSLKSGLSPKKSMRATIVEHYSHALRLPSHMEELMALCREHRPGAVWRLGLEGIHHEEYA